MSFQKSIYDSIDKETETPIDRQIDLDIPRCHQYHPLLASPEGHAKMRRILKCWATYNSRKLVYWQGLDSVLSPLLTLFFDDESKAYCCLQAFVDQYLYNFYVSDNNTFLKGHLLAFRHLLAYHDPKLALHLYQNGFHPDYYAISWFLTLFSQYHAGIFYIQNTYRIWDAFLTGPRSLPIFMAVAIMRQLRTRLLEGNDIIHIFSNLPYFDILQCLDDAAVMYQNTPFQVTNSFEKTLLEAKGVHHSLDSAIRWWEQSVPLETELHPRVMVQDLRESQLPTVVLDVRSEQEYKAARYPGSIHFSIEDQRENELQLELLDIYKGSHIVIVGNLADQTSKFANKLIFALFPYVSVLLGGIDALEADAKDILEISDK